MLDLRLGILLGLVAGLVLVLSWSWCCSWSGIVLGHGLVLILVFVLGLGLVFCLCIWQSLGIIELNINKKPHHWSTELFSFPDQLSGGYRESSERTDQPHVAALRFFPKWRFRLLIGPAHFTRCCRLLRILDTTGVMPGTWQRWQNHGKVMTQPGFKPGAFR